MKIFVLIFVIAFLIGCNQTSPPANARIENLQSVTTHSTESKTPPALNANASNSDGRAKTKWSQSGDPIDTKEFDAAIMKTEKDLSTNPSDPAAKKALAESYFKRGFALTEARQYASALGDYRRALKYEPDHEESQRWINQIILIYDTLKKEYPNEGEEPPPLKVNK